MAHTAPPRESAIDPIGQSAPAPSAVTQPIVQVEREARVIHANKAPRRSAQREQNSVSTHPLLQGVANIPFYAVQGADSHFVADATALYNALDIMDVHMVSIRRFHENTPLWMPLVSQLYVGVIWIMYNLLCARSAGNISVDANQALSWFMDLFPLQNLPVPGPLVPFFQSIANCSGPYEAWGDVSPKLPTPDGSRASWYFYSNGLNRLIPPVHIFFDQIQFLARLAQTVIDNIDDSQIHLYHNVLGNNSPAAAGTALWDFLGNCPGVANRSILSSSQIRVWYNNRHGLSLPGTRMVTTATAGTDVQGPGRPLAILEYLRFGTAGTAHPNWFPVVLSIMQRYSQFFAGSTSLATIRTAGIGSSIPIWKHVATSQRIVGRPTSYVTTVTHTNTPINYVTWSIARNQPATSSVGDPTLVPNQDGSDPHRIARQLSAVTQPNASFSVAATGATYNDLPDDAVLRDGPVWTITELAQSPPVDNTLVIPQNILGMFVADTRMQ